MKSNYWINNHRIVVVNNAINNIINNAIKNIVNYKKISPRFFIVVLLCLVLLFGAFSPLHRPSSHDRLLSYGSIFPTWVSWPDDMLEYQEIDDREEGLEMSGRIPVLTQYAGPIQTRINSVINQTIASKISEAREVRARTLTFAYETYFSDPYMSIILKSTAASASSKTEVVSINFNTNNGELIYAADVVGLHVVQLADRLLVEMVRRNPERYNPGFAGMREDQAFSITDREIIFWFNEFQLAPGFEGIVPLPLDLDSIKEVTLSRSDYRIREGFNLKMIPIRVLTDLGYEVSWDEINRRISVFHNGELVINLTPGVNDYVRESRFTRSLEAAPELIDGFTYVPISFFDQILSLVTFTIDDQNNITFASYPVTDGWFER